jgi:hypothetical protein
MSVITLKKLLIVSGPVILTRSQNTCTLQDMSFVGSPDSFIRSILECSSEVGGESGSIFACMRDGHPQFPSVRRSCLQCTVGVLEADIGLTCLPKCINDISSSGCQTCTPGLITAFSNSCRIDLSVNPNDGNTDGDTTIVDKCTSLDITSIMNSGGITAFVSSEVIECVPISGVPTCMTSVFANLSSACQSCVTNILTHSESCVGSCMQTNSCPDCSDSVSTEFASECTTSDMQTTKSSRIQSGSDLINLIGLAVLISNL